jgi:hypothetical protein
LVRSCDRARGVASTLELIDLATNGSTDLSVENFGPGEIEPVALGSRWIRLRSFAYKDYPERDLDIATGRLLAPPEEAQRTWEDLDSAALGEPLCRPVVRPRLPDPPSQAGDGTFYGVVGADHGWFLLSGWAARVNGGDDALLLLWHCGRRQPLVLRATSFRFQAQLGGGILTWLGRHGEIEALRLATGRRWKWHRRGGFCEVVHTRAAVYAIAAGDCGGSRQVQVLTASLAGLWRA